jgi:hypothetical protein
MDYNNEPMATIAGEMDKEEEKETLTNCWDADNDDDEEDATKAVWLRLTYKYSNTALNKSNGKY